MLWLATGVLALYLVLGTVLAVVARRMGIRSSVDYYVAGYRLGGFLAAMTYAATTYSAFMIVGLVGFAYSTGVGALGFELVYFVGTMLLLSTLAPRVWELARKRGWVSPAEMLSDLYGSRTVGALVAAIYLAALVPYMGAQVKGIAEAFDALSRGLYGYGVLLAVAIMLLWTLLAGIWSVAVTDALQGLWMILAALLLLGWLVAWLPGEGVDLVEATRLLSERKLLGLTEFWSLSVFLGFTIPWIFFAATNPQVVQRLFMPRDPTALRRMVVWFAVFGVAYTVVVTLIGLLARAASEAGLMPLLERRDAVTPTLLTLTHPLIAALVFTSIVAAAVSTADSIALSVASAVVRDLYGAVKPEASERLQILLGRVIVAALIAAAAAVALTRIGFIVALSVLSSAILLSIAPATILAWARPESVKGLWPAALASIAVGAAIGFTATALLGVRALVYTPVPQLPLPVPAWILIASTAIIAVGYTVKKAKRA
jgi:SSS family solute:Na+ symporter